MVTGWEREYSKKSSKALVETSPSAMASLGRYTPPALPLTSGLPVIRPKRTRIESEFNNFGSTNDVESAFPARVWEEMHQNVADPRELVAESCLFKLWLCGLERPIVEQRTAKY